MASNEREKHPLVTTPRGIFVFPHLHAPDTKYDADGAYTVKLSLNPSKPEDAAFIAKLDELNEWGHGVVSAEKGKKQKKLGPRYTEEEDGTVTTSAFKMKAKVTRKRDGKVFTLRPTLYNAKGEVVEFGLKIAGGTVGKISFTPVPTPSPSGAGIKLQLEAVQVISLKTWGGRSAEGHGFGEEEGDFSDVSDDASDAPFADESGEDDELPFDTEGADF